LDRGAIFLICFWGGLGVLVVLLWAVEKVPPLLPRLWEKVRDAWDRIEDGISPKDAREFERALDELFVGFDLEREKAEIVDIAKAEKARAAQALREAVTPEYHCPKCAGVMLRSTGRYGTFYSYYCTNYPSCRYSKKRPKAS